MRIVLLMLFLAQSTLIFNQGIRYLNFEEGVSIASRLQPGDRVARVEKALPPLAGGVPRNLTAQEILEGETLHAAAVLVVQLTSRQYTLTRKADWIVTRFRGEILEQLKPNSLTLRLDNFVLESEGGILNIGSTRVEATAYWEPKFELQRRYLLFPGSRRWPASSLGAYEISSDGKLRNISPGFDPKVDTDNLHGFPFDKAKSIILSAPPRGRPPIELPHMPPR